MPGIDRATGRVIALILLLVLAGAALRGYLPAAAKSTRRSSTGSPAELVVVVVLIGVSLGIIAVAIITRMRTRRAAAGSIGALSVGPSGPRGRPNWRVLLVGFAVIAAWVLIVWLAARWIGQYGFGRIAPASGGDDVPAPEAGTPPASGAPKPGRPQPNSGADSFGYLAATTIAMLLLLFVGAAAARSRRGTESAQATVAGRAPAAAADVAALVRAAEDGLAAVGDLDRDPRAAIIGCYATMERELAHVPDVVPQDFDTPTEVLARAVESHALSADSATRLVTLFAEARFSSHRMTELQRQDAVRMLRRVLAELRSPA